MDTRYGTRRTFRALPVLAAMAAAFGLLAQPALAKQGDRPGDGLTQADIQKILSQGVMAANKVVSPLRSLPAVQRSTKMHIAVVARDGKFLDIRSMPDAWVGSIDIAIAKGRTAAFFSSNENALTSRVIGVLSQAHGAGGLGEAGPLWGIGNSNQVGITGGPEYRNGIITFPGGVPLYKNGKLVGAVGVSGDGVDQDEAVAFAAAAGFAPGANVAQAGMTPPSVPMMP